MLENVQHWLTMATILVQNSNQLAENTWHSKIILVDFNSVHFVKIKCFSFQILFWQTQPVNNFTVGFHLSWIVGFILSLENGFLNQKEQYTHFQ